MPHGHLLLAALTPRRRPLSSLSLASFSLSRLGSLSPAKPPAGPELARHGRCLASPFCTTPCSAEVPRSSAEPPSSFPFEESSWVALSHRRPSPFPCRYQGPPPPDSSPSSDPHPCRPCRHPQGELRPISPSFPSPRSPYATASGRRPASRVCLRARPHGPGRAQHEASLAWPVNPTWHSGPLVSHFG
jgi:hypothetical protein